MRDIDGQPLPPEDPEDPRGELAYEQQQRRREVLKWLGVAVGSSAIIGAVGLSYRTIQHYLLIRDLREQWVQASSRGYLEQLRALHQLNSQLREHRIHWDDISKPAERKRVILDALHNLLAQPARQHVRLVYSARECLNTHTELATDPAIQAKYKQVMSIFFKQRFTAKEAVVDLNEQQETVTTLLALVKDQPVKLSDLGLPESTPDTLALEQAELFLQILEQQQAAPLNSQEQRYAKRELRRIFTENQLIVNEKTLQPNPRLTPEQQQTLRDLWNRTEP